MLWCTGLWARSAQAINGRASPRSIRILLFFSDWETPAAPHSQNRERNNKKKERVPVYMYDGRHIVEQQAVLVHLALGWLWRTGPPLAMGPGWHCQALPSIARHYHPAGTSTEWFLFSSLYGPYTTNGVYYCHAVPRHNQSLNRFQKGQSAFIKHVLK